MKCQRCKEGSYREGTVTEEVTVPGHGVVVVAGLEVLECDRCQSRLMERATYEKQTRVVLTELVRVYSQVERRRRMPGETAAWIRKAVQLSAAEVARLAGGLDPSALSQAASRGGNVDALAATVLLQLAVDFVNGSEDGQELIRAFGEPDQRIETERRPKMRPPLMRAEEPLFESTANFLSSVLEKRTQESEFLGALYRSKDGRIRLEQGVPQSKESAWKPLASRTRAASKRKRALVKNR